MFFTTPFFDTLTNNVIHGTRSENCVLSVKVGVYGSVTDVIKPPETLCMNGNMDANWKTFWQRFLLYMSDKMCFAEFGMTKSSHH